MKTTLNTYYYTWFLWVRNWVPVLAKCCWLGGHHVAVIKVSPELRQLKAAQGGGSAFRTVPTQHCWLEASVLTRGPLPSALSTWQMVSPRASDPRKGCSVCYDLDLDCHTLSFPSSYVED